MTPIDFSAAIPQTLKQLTRFVAWGPDPDSGRPKCPLLISNRAHRASTRKPTTWSPWVAAEAFWTKYGAEPGYGIGFVFADGDGLVYLDLDDAVEDGALRPWANIVAPLLGKSFWEISPSGHGLHIIAKGSLPTAGCGGKVNLPDVASAWAKEQKRTPELAMFSSGKYTTLSGDVVPTSRDLGPDCTVELAAIWAATGITATGTDKQAGPMPDDDAVGKIDKRRVPKAVRDELANCTAGEAADRSAARFKLYAAASARLEPEEVFALVMASDTWYIASGASEKGAEHTWIDICRACAKADTAAKEFAEVKEQEAEVAEKTVTTWRELGLPVVEHITKSGTETSVAYGVHAMLLVLTRHPKWKGRLRRNLMTQQVELDGVPLTESTSGVAEAMRAYLGWEREPQMNLVLQAMLEAAEQQAINPISDWVKSLTWDGTARMDDWLVRAGCEDTSVARKVGRKWLIALIARALKPGCKMDDVLILVGEQGRKKSTLLEAIAGEGLFTDSSVAFERDDKMVMHRRWVIELSELAAFKKAAQETVKKFFRQKVDSFRAPYAREVRDHPRHFLIVGSTNDPEFLSDATGNRVYWPVKVPKDVMLDVAWVREFRVQLLAEARVAFDAGEDWWFEKSPQDLIEAQQAHEVEDALDGFVATALKGLQADRDGLPEFKLSELMQLMGADAGNKGLQMRITAILHGRGLFRARRRRLGSPGVVSKPEWVWRDPTKESFETAEIIEFSTVPTGKGGNGDGNSSTGGKD
jgi:hypothetical protein